MRAMDGAILGTSNTIVLHQWFEWLAYRMVWPLSFGASGCGHEASTPMRPSSSALGDATSEEREVTSPHVVLDVRVLESGT